MGHEEIGTHSLAYFAGMPFHLDTEVATWLVLAVLLLLMLWLKRSIRLVPSGIQVIFEGLVEYLDNIAIENIGPKGRNFMPLIFSLFLFIFVSNQIGMLPTGGYIKSPTADLNTNLGLALMVFFAVHAVTIKEKGLGGWLGHFCKPVIFFLPINIIEELAKPITLSFRLFGNIVAGEIVMFVLGLLLPWWLPIPAGWLLFSLFVGLIQAFIFTMLTVSYLSGAFAGGH